MKKTIIITGASSGIGKETAKYFAGKGWNVAATMRSPEEENTLGNIPNIKKYKLDVTSGPEIIKVLQQVSRDFPQIDVLLNNAGYGAVGVFEKSTDKEIREQFDVNVFGLISMTREMIPYFRKQGFGTIINVSSLLGRMTVPVYSIYSTTKWAVEGFSESLKFELKAFNIKVKLIEPGAVKTDFYGRSQQIFQNDEIKGYENLEERVFEYMQKSKKNASHPIVVAKTIYKAATDGKNKLRYAAGKKAKMALFSRGLLPARWFNAAVQKATDKISK